MRRRLTFPPPSITPAVQARLNHKEASLNLILEQIEDRMTFKELGGLVGYSHEWVRQRLVPERKADLFQIGNRYQIPKGVAVELVRSIFN